MAFLNRAGTTWGWTRRFSLIPVLVVLTMAFSFMVVMDSNGPLWAHVLLLGLVIMASVRAGAAGGLVVGLVGAALHTAVGNIDTGGEAHSATLSVVVLCFFLVYGWTFGLTASYLRRRQETDARQSPTAGAGHSQGLLTAAEGKAVLDLEREQARVSGDQLAVLIVTATVRDGVGPRQAAHAFRAIARTFEAAASGGQQPVLVSEGKLAMVIPGGEPEDLIRLERYVVSAMADTTYADREAGTRPTSSTALTLESKVVALKETQAAAEIQVAAEALFSLPERRLARAERRSAVSSRTAA